MTSKSIIQKTVSWLMLLLTTAFVLIPLYMIATASFKNERDIFEAPLVLWTENSGIFNFKQLDRFPLYIWNSIKVTFFCTVIQLGTASTSAYAFSKLKWRGRDALFVLYLMSMMIPIQVIIIPQFMVIKNLGLYNSHLALILVGSFTVFGTFLIKQFFMTLPDSIMESARIDGAHEWVIFLRIVMPLAKTVMATVLIFSFRWFWNEFFSALIYIASPELKTLPLGMTDFVTEYMVYFGPQMAAALISIVPVMILFLSLQKYFIQGIASSGIKG
ncbi:MULTISPECIES: carbohydrate ABC transporter permease [unclassified Oceanispirochaeta]|uniref:carbohydrate ABC transporter permease n=1 Tax=unclassified Oceanispirochaeta TaxID=2635722 RepID=UPI000E08FFD3|nr:MULTISPECIES: carbohydrate ABC transporter permease [unclassified Oceanispirochaeta]MBF9016797.1 carbohydrate ABC transporter permease [Oceanispirochaeta sp. M2]NPD72067.1 carbohydrate ABC transporter permease [Oceanispirochaeta sp. M1]RDG32510.1 carbohydrate ABC transporter permease [Oceanispirochaeta sp. M1]